MNKRNQIDPDHIYVKPYGSTWMVIQYGKPIAGPFARFEDAIDEKRTQEEAITTRPAARQAQEFQHGR